MASPIKLAVVGFSAGLSWAATAHIPYLKETNKYKITAIANSSIESSQKAAEQYGVNKDQAYESVEKLVNSADADLVAVSVKTPFHKVLLFPAIKAKKDVFVEWPLGKDIQEAEELTKLVEEA